MIDYLNKDEKDCKTKLRTANIELSSIKGMVKLIILPFIDHSVTLASTFAIADTEYNILQPSVFTTIIKLIDSENSKLILKCSPSKTAN